MHARERLLNLFYLPSPSHHPRILGLKSVFAELTVESPITFQICKSLVHPLLEIIYQVQIRSSHIYDRHSIFNIFSLLLSPCLTQIDVAAALEALDVLNDLLLRFGTKSYIFLSILDCWKGAWSVTYQFRCRSHHLHHHHHLSHSH